MRLFRLGSLSEAGEEEFGGVKIITKGDVKSGIGFSWSPNRVNHLKLFSGENNKADWWLCRLALSGKMMMTRPTIIPLIRTDDEILVAVKSQSVMWFAPYDWVYFGQKNIGTNGAAPGMITIPFRTPDEYLAQWNLSLPNKGGELVNLNHVTTIAQERMSWGRVDKIPA